MAGRAQALPAGPAPTTSASQAAGKGVTLIVADSR
jgi:hypothetical protein